MIIETTDHSSYTCFPISRIGAFWSIVRDSWNNQRERNDYWEKTSAFTVQDLKLMVKMDLKIVFIETESLKTEGEDLELLEFVEVLRKMKNI